MARLTIKSTAKQLEAIEIADIVATDPLHKTCKIVVFDDGSEALFSVSKQTSLDEESGEMIPDFLDADNKMLATWEFRKGNDGLTWMQKANAEREQRSIASLRR